METIIKMMTSNRLSNVFQLKMGLGHCWILEQCPLQWLLNEINSAIKAKIYYSAISVCLTLPHICSALEREDGRGERDGYYSWYRKYMAGFKYLTAEDAYSFRNGVLHQGRFGDLSHEVSRVFFIGEGPVTISDCLVNDMYFHSAHDFCAQFSDAVQQWWQDVKGDPVVARNLTNLVKYHPNGVAPIARGIMVIG